MSLNDSIRQKLIVGLADIAAGEDVYAVTRHTTGTSNALTIASTTLRLGATGGTLGFFNANGSTRATSTGVTDVAGLVTVLRNYGLFS